MKKQNLLILTLLLIIINIDVIDCKEKDLYKILEVPRNADAAQMKKSYRKLTIKYHPDRNKGSQESKDKFADVAEAYTILTDPKKRRLYDRGGMEAIQKGEQEAQQGGGGHPFGDMFGGFFDQEGGHGGQRRDHDLRIKIRASLLDLYNGKDIGYLYTRNIICPHCRGSGAESYDDIKECNRCGGRGHVLQRQEIAPGFVQTFQAECPKCNGKGKVTAKHCHVCHGDKIVKGMEDLSVFVEKGMRNGQEIKFDDLGEERADINPGNLIFVVKELPHKVFKREGNNLKIDYTISLKEALLGFAKDIIHVDNHIVKINRNTVTQPGEVIRIRNEGMPVHESSGEFGDLIVTIKVEFPEKLTEKQLLIADKLFKMRNFWG